MAGISSVILSQKFDRLPIAIFLCHRRKTGQNLFSQYKHSLLEAAIAPKEPETETIWGNIPFFRPFFDDIARYGGPIEQYGVSILCRGKVNMIAIHSPKRFRIRFDFIR